MLERQLQMHASRMKSSTPIGTASEKKTSKKKAKKAKTLTKSPKKGMLEKAAAAREKEDKKMERNIAILSDSMDPKERKSLRKLKKSLRNITAQR